MPLDRLSVNRFHLRDPLNACCEQDIVPLFKASPNDHVDLWAYTSEMEDFTKGRSVD
jgi:hypothetical protein